MLDRGGRLSGVSRPFLYTLKEIEWKIIFLITMQ